MKDSMTTRQNARVMMTAQIPLDRAIEIDTLAKDLGITRHRLLVLAINAGIPQAVAQVQAGKAAAQQQTKAVKE